MLCGSIDRCSVSSLGLNLALLLQKEGPQSLLRGNFFFSIFFFNLYGTSLLAIKFEEVVANVAKGCLSIQGSGTRGYFSYKD